MIEEEQQIEENMQMVETLIEIDNQKEDISIEEQVIKRLLQEWRHIDERFIPKDQKQLYKETFQRYRYKQKSAIISQPKQLGAQANQGQEIGTQGKGAEKEAIKQLMNPYKW